MTSPIQSSNIYDLEYFSGAQMNMYIGDVLIDEVTGLQIQVQQRKLPVFGYASQLFDKVAKGTVMVEGAFTVNFKESGYLYTVLDRYKKLSSGSSAAVLSPFIGANSISQLPKDRSGGAKKDGSHGLLRRQNIEQVKRTVNKVVDGTNVRPEDLIDYYRSLTGFNNTAPSRNGSAPGALNTAEDSFEAFEDKIWGSSALSADSEGRRGDSNRFDDFTIYITLGDYNRNDRVNHTARRIDNVHLVGQSQTIMINGEPVAEQYSFIARNFV